MQKIPQSSEKNARSYFVIMLAAIGTMVIMIIADILPYHIPRARYQTAIKEFDAAINEYPQYTAIDATIELFSRPEANAAVLAKCNELITFYKIGEKSDYYQVKAFFWLKTRYLTFDGDRAIMKRRSDKMRMAWSGSLKFGFLYENAVINVIEFDDQKNWLLGELTGWLHKTTVAEKK